MSTEKKTLKTQQVPEKLDEPLVQKIKSKKEASSSKWLMLGGSVLIIIAGLLYSQHLESTVLNKTGSVPDVNEFDAKLPDANKGYANLKETWKESFVLQYENNKISIICIKCSSSEPTINEILSNLVKDISQSIPNLLDLSLDPPMCKSLVDKGLIDLGSSIRGYLPSLKRLSFGCKSCSEITSKGMKEFAEHIAYLQNLEHFSISIQHSENITDDSLRGLAVAFNKYPKNLKKLSLKFSTKSTITDEGFKSLAESIRQNFKDLESLTLLFRNCEALTSNSLKQLADTILNIPNLLELSIDLGQWKITDEAVGYLTSSIGQKMQKLENLTLSFYKTDIGSEGAKQVGLCIGQNLPNLKHLSIDFAVCQKLPDSGILSFAKGVQQSPANLQSLSINLAGLTITDQTATEVFAIINNRPNLKKLSLNCFGCQQITDMSLTSLIRSINERLSKIQSLSFEFGLCPKITDASMKELASLKEEHTNSLKAVTLSFSGHQGVKSITNSGLESLSNFIGRLHNIEKLKLELKTYASLGNDGLMTLANGLSKSFPHLKDLTLIFASSPFGDAGINYITYAVTAFHKNLKSLTLDFHANTVVSDVGASQVALDLSQSMKNLDQLTLGFVMCAKVTDKTVNVVNDTIVQKLTHLQELSLKFYRTGASRDATDKVVKNIKNNFKNLRSLTFLSPDMLKPDSKEFTEALNFLGEIPEVIYN